ncbi:uncharacterized protein VTP21DRAFT_4391 [Calcarisporiella thermophila]|uniref:uncharacterized protein n=1 Tax=Calcarisporiella thermophila TaxID=911321 RepID=UPI00374256EA
MEHPEVNVASQPNSQEKTSVKTEGDRERELGEAERLAKETPLPSGDDGELSSASNMHNRGITLAQQRVRRLVMWEHPAESGGVLSGFLALLYLSGRFSPLGLIFLIGFCLTGLNLCYVTVYKKLYGDVNPLDNLRNKRNLELDQSRVSKYVSLCVDVINVFLQETLKIVLIEDTVRSFKWLGILFLLWNISYVFPTRVILATCALLGFTLPRIYVENKEMVDQNLARGQKVLHENIRRVSDAAKESATELSAKMNQITSQRGISTEGSVAAAKEE